MKQLPLVFYHHLHKHLSENSHPKVCVNVTWLIFWVICDLRRFFTYAAIDADLGRIVDDAAIDADFGCSVIEYFVDTFSNVNTGFTI